MASTPPTGTAIPRPVKRDRVVLPTADADELAPKPMLGEKLEPTGNKTIDDIFALIDARMPPEITARISSIPAPAPRQSLAVRAAKKSPRWAAYLLSALMVTGQIIAAAAQPEYRGPIVQATKLIQLAVSEWLEDDPTTPPDAIEPLK